MATTKLCPLCGGVPVARFTAGLDRAVALLEQERRFTVHRKQDGSGSICRPLEKPKTTNGGA